MRDRCDALFDRQRQLRWSDRQDTPFSPAGGLGIHWTGKSGLILLYADGSDACGRRVLLTVPGAVCPQPSCDGQRQAGHRHP